MPEMGVPILSTSS